MKSISTPRVYFIQLLCLGLISGLIYHSWVQNSAVSGATAKKSSKDPTTELASTYQTKAFLIESQITLVALEWIKRNKQSETAQQLSGTIRSSFSQSVKQLHPAFEAESTTISDLQRQKLIFSEWLGLSKEKELFCEHISRLRSEDSKLDTILLATCQNNQSLDSSANTASLSEQQLQLVEKQLGWFGKLLRSMTVPQQDSQEYFNREVYAPAMARLIGFGKIAAIGGSAAILSFLGFVLLVSKLARGKLNMRFRKAAFEDAYLLEVFTLYLLAMFLVPFGIKSAIGMGLKVNVLQLNIFAIGSLSLLAFWPILCGRKKANLEEALGLAGSNWSKTIGDILAGPFTYFSSLSALLIVMMIYALSLTLLGVNPSSGAHPIVPILSQTKSSNTIYYIFILAVIVAPFVEEVMFRGAFYSWLRERLGAFSAIFISSLVFAAVHPQGALGLIPLTCIGMVFAFLREWRGTLTSCMLAHACFNCGTLVLAMNLLR